MASAIATGLDAQTAIAIPGATFGDRVHLQSPGVLGTVVSGRLTEANQGFVTVTVGDTRRASVAVPWARITSINLAVGRDRESATKKGALIGLGAALIAAPAFGHGMDGSPIPSGFVAIRDVALLSGLGALVGWQVSPPRWKPVAWRPSIDTVMAEGEAIRLWLTPGELVQVRANRQTFKARVLLVGDSLVLNRGSSEARLSWSEVSDLRIRGSRNRLRGAAIGFTAVTLASLVALQASSRPPASKSEFLVDRILIGTAFGALVGTAGWSRVPIPIH